MARKSAAEYLAEVRDLARERGGSLLSREYVDDTTKLHFRCAAGHDVRQTPGGLKQGKWCWACGRALTGAKLKARAVVRLTRIIERRGGAILSGAYVNSQTRMRFKCHKGHTWETVPASILHGSWCGTCAIEHRKTHQFERRRRGVHRRLLRIVQGHRGEILSEELTNYRTPIQVRCAKSHIWDALPQSIDQGGWCSICEDGTALAVLGRRVKRLGGEWRPEAWRALPDPPSQVRNAREDSARHLAQLQRIALARGGRLLSSTYVDDTKKLRFRCAKGHEWLHTPSGIKQGRWCLTCGRARTGAKKKAPAMENFHRIVAGRGGTVLSPAYVNSQTRLRFRCADGHEWSTTPGSIVQGGWCPDCAVEYRKRTQHANRKLVVLKRLTRRAKRHGGRVLSPAFVGTHTPLRFHCARGHTWEALAASIDEGVWCPTCKENALLATLREKAEQRGGECLSQTCRNWKSVLDWRCAQGHRFRVAAAAVRDGGWCRRCGSYVRGDIEQMRQLARERGGRCLSETYVDAVSKLRWRCREGHEWKSDASNVVQGHWCPECSKWRTYSRVRLSMDDMRKTAAGRGGECLSTEYHGNKVPLRWRCASGHSWMAHPNRIRQGAWCPACSHSAPGTLDGIRALAIKRGGRCLTRSWFNHQLPLRFECGRGHRFDAEASAVKTGVWCPTCLR